MVERPQVLAASQRTGLDAALAAPASEARAGLGAGAVHGAGGHGVSGQEAGDIARQVLAGLRPAGLAMRLLRGGVLVASDLAALLLSGAIAYVGWAYLVRGQPAAVYLELLPLATLFLLGYGKAGLYPGFGVGAVATIRLLSTWTSFTFLLMAATSFAVRAPQHYARVAFALAWLLALLLVPAFRLATLRVVRRVPGWLEPVVLVGTGRQVRRTIDALGDAVSLGYRPIGVLSPVGQGTGERIAGVAVIGDLELAAPLARRGIRTVFVEPREEEAATSRQVERLQADFRHVVVLRGLADVPVEGVVIRNLGGLLGIEFNNRLLLLRNRVVKRGLDLVLGSLAFVAAVPVIALAALAVKLADRGPAFFRQDREGLGGVTIPVWKIRTMYADGDLRLERHLAANPVAREDWQKRFKLADDPRVLPGIGQLLRRFSLDELPQLWQVLRGDLSLVGPRPFPDYHLEKFEPAFRALRRRVRPGVTGLWQVMIRSEGGVEEQQSYDTYYIRNWSFWMDLYILVKTAGVIISGRGAY